MNAIDTLLSVLAPHACFGCGKEGSVLCEWCVFDAFEPTPSRCYRCKRLTIGSATCIPCKRYAPIRHVWVCAQYQGTAKQLLRCFKFERVRSAAPLIAEAMHAALPYLPSTTLIVPVPTATSRIRQRGYDHAVLLAQEISRETGLKTQSALIRLTQSRQVGADRSHRLAQLEGAYSVPLPRHIQGKHVLLIDDVVTTGATLRAATKELKRAGAKSVSALVYAQKQ